MICYVSGCVCYGSENFGLVTLHYYYVCLSDASPHFYTVAPYKFHYRFVDEWIIFCRQMGYFSLTTILFLVFISLFFWAIYSFQINLQSNYNTRYFTASVRDMIVCLTLTARQVPLRMENLMGDGLDPLTLIFHLFSDFSIIWKCFWRLR